MYLCFCNLLRARRITRSRKSTQKCTSSALGPRAGENGLVGRSQNLVWPCLRFRLLQAPNLKTLEVPSPPSFGLHILLTHPILGSCVFKQRNVSLRTSHSTMCSEVLYVSEYSHCPHQRGNSRSKVLCSPNRTCCHSMDMPD